MSIKLHPHRFVFRMMKVWKPLLVFKNGNLSDLLITICIASMEQNYSAVRKGAWTRKKITLRRRAS